MKLHRLATITLGEEVVVANGFEFSMGPITVEGRRTTYNGEPDRRWLLIATVELENVDIDSESFVEVPQLEREACESAIEVVANTLAVFGRTKRTIASPTPTVALSDLSLSEIARLDASRGFEGGLREGTVSANYELDLVLARASSARIHAFTLRGSPE